MRAKNSDSLTAIGFLMPRLNVWNSAEPKLGPASHPSPAQLKVIMPKAKNGSIGTLFISQSISMLTRSVAPAVPPMNIVMILLVTWKRRRVLRRAKKVFQSRTGVEDPGAVAVEA